jgi:hypothetical protein
MRASKCDAVSQWHSSGYQPAGQAELHVVPPQLVTGGVPGPA